MNTGGAGDIGTGWEHYLDMLIATRESATLPSFDDYYPSMSAHFTDQVAAISWNQSLAQVAGIDVCDELLEVA